MNIETKYRSPSFWSADKKKTLVSHTKGVMISNSDLRVFEYSGLGDSCCPCLERLGPI